MRMLPALLAMIVLAGCAGVRSYSRDTLVPVADAYACAADQLKEMGYTLVLEDPVGGLVQGRREITGLVETARKGAATATKVITAGLAGGAKTRFDELTIFVHTGRYPQSNLVEATAGMFVTDGDSQERSSPTDDAKNDARTLLGVCAPRR